jgi:hypothetical protein
MCTLLARSKFVAGLSLWTGGCLHVFSIVYPVDVWYISVGFSCNEPDCCHSGKYTLFVMQGLDMCSEQEV